MIEAKEVKRANRKRLCRWAALGFRQGRKEQASRRRWCRNEGCDMAGLGVSAQASWVRREVRPGADN